MSGVTTTQDYSTGVSADVVSVCHSVWCDNFSKLLNRCQLMWRLLAMMPGVTTAQDYSTGVSADVASACHDDWCDNCSRLLN